MVNCQKIYDLISEGSDEHRQAGMQLLFEDTKLKKVVIYFHKRYSSLLNSFYSWEDLLSETIIRITTEIKAGRGPRTNCRGYFRNVCRNICEEYRRQDQRTKETLRIQAKIVKIPENIVIRERVENYLKEIGGQCEILLRLIYFEEPPIVENDQLAEALNKKGFNVKSNVIPTVRSRCLRKLRKLFGGDSSSLFDE